MDYKTIFFPESTFGGFSDHDGTVIFYSRVNALLNPASIVVDFGCGRGAYKEDKIVFRRELRILRGKGARVIGLDADQAAASNPFIDEFCLLETDVWPMADNSADLCLCDQVLEHLARPEVFFSEAHRVLRNKGYLCIRTPNTWSYVALVSRLIPNRSHAAVLDRVKGKNPQRDVYPTYYRSNSLKAIKNNLLKHGFKGITYGYEAEPSYLAFSRITYFLGIAFARLAPGWARSSIFSYSQLEKTG
jgi:SAM-dependent methyltransferase